MVGIKPKGPRGLELRGRLLGCWVVDPDWPYRSYGVKLQILVDIFTWYSMDFSGSCKGW